MRLAGEPKKRRKQYRLLFQRSPEPIWVYDAETLGFLAVNDAAIKHYGYSRKEFLAMTIKDLHPPEELPHLVMALGRGRNVTSECVLRKKDGTDLNVEILCCKLTWLGRPSRLVLAKDITNHKRVLKALEDAKQKYRGIFENAVVGMFQTTEDGRLLTANSAFARIYGFESPEELMRSVGNVSRLYVDAARHEEFLRLLNERGAVWGFEAQHYRKDARPIWILESARAVRDPSGKVLCFEGSVHSITDRKEAEEALRELSGRLLRLQDEERRHIARELHDSMAQDMAALVRNLRGLKELDGLAPSARATLSESLALAEKCTQGIRTLSYLLHPPLLDDVGLASALRWYVDGYTERSGIQVQLLVSAECGRLPRELERTIFRIVQESLTNVQRHAGGRKAKIELVVSPDDVHLEVQDDGQGISSEILKKFRASGAGLGVGIAGMRERVRQFGGRLSIESSSLGTTVRAAFPLQRLNA